MPLTLLALDPFRPGDHGCVDRDGVRQIKPRPAVHPAGAMFVTAIGAVAARTHGEFEEWTARKEQEQ